MYKKTYRIWYHNTPEISIKYKNMYKKTYRIWYHNKMLSQVVSFVFKIEFPVNW